MILVLGASGQDGKIMQDYFVKLKRDDVILVDRNKNIHTNSFINIIGDLNDFEFINKIIKKHEISHIFNFATSSFVNRESEGEILKRTCKVFQNLIKSIEINKKKEVWIFHPLSSEVFGNPKSSEQGLSTSINPTNAYGLQKSYELIQCRFLNTKGFNIFHPILYNHDSKYRPERFLPKKVISNLLNFNSDQYHAFEFHNAYSSRDFGSAQEFVNLFIFAMDNNFTGDEVIGTGINMTVLDFIRKTLKALDIKYKIEKCNGLVKIFSNDSTLIAVEKDRDKFDEKRKFKFDKNFRNKQLSAFPLTGGDELIRMLINEHQSLD